MAENLKYSISPEGCINYANRLIELCELCHSKISSVENINSSFLVSLFEKITGHNVPDLLSNNDSMTEVHNIQALIDTLSLDLLDASLSHLTGEDIVDGNCLSILNLLELLEAVFLYLIPQKKESLKDVHDNLEDENFAPTASTTNFIRKTFPVKSQSSSSDENIPLKKILKRKTCKKTLQKPRQNPHVPRKMSEVSEVEEFPRSKRQSDTLDGPKSPLKRKLMQQSSTTVKRLRIEGIEELHKLNFENKVRALLHCDESPILRAQQMKRNYVKNLKKSFKKPISPCRKSFLLPHNLQHRHKSCVPQSPNRKKTSQRKKMKSLSCEVAGKSKNADDTPAFIKSIMKEFPGFKFSDNTSNLLTQQYYQHVGLMHKQLREALLKKPKSVIQTERAMEEEAKLNKILLKDLKEKSYLDKLNEQRAAENKIKSGFRDARLQSAKTRQYFNEFHKSMREKLRKKNFSEEILIEKTFKEILDIQKEKIRQLCQRVKEADEQDAKQHRQYLSALKNLYQEQLSLLGDSITAEQKDSSMRAKAEKWAVEKTNQEFRKTLLEEVRSLQSDVLDMIDDIHFRELDAQNFIQSFREQD